MEWTPEALLAMMPLRAVGFEAGEGGLVTLLRPKFVSPWLAWMQPLLPRPVFRVKLDEVGTFIWLLLDGTRSVADICGQVEARFGPRVDPVQERTLTFVWQMLEARFLRSGS